MHEMHNNREGTYNKNDMSEIRKVELDDDKADIKFILHKMKHNK